VAHRAQNGRSRTVARRAGDDLRDLRLRRVLAQRAEEVAERLARHGAGALLVEERKGLFVLCARGRVNSGL
jgi:hypothetical protein